MKWGLEKGPALLGAIIILAAGFVLARVVCRLLQSWLEKREMEPPVRMLLTRVTWLMIMALFVMVALGTLGIAVGPLIAMLGVAGVGIGLAMQGVLGNLVSGLLIIFTKPFRVGEYIEIAGNYGQVTAIELFSTTLLHPDKSRVVIPNRKISGEILHNYGTLKQHDITINVAYNTNLPEAIAVIQDVLARNANVLKDPAPVVAVGRFADSGIDIEVKPFSKLTEFGAAAAEVKLGIVDAFRERKIEIPFPQREVRVLGPATMTSYPSGETRAASLL
ncbi:MAG TPA: mechanosensitive ion channel family protein [Verrucomicrobiae bacterium]|nr:mechanosensitive ion channel family protein [Verrucomicrobiae bacterium]